MKIKRRVIAEKYKDVIDRMYADAEESLSGERPADSLRREDERPHLERRICERYESQEFRQRAESSRAPGSFIFSAASSSVNQREVQRLARVALDLVRAPRHERVAHVVVEVGRLALAGGDVVHVDVEDLVRQEA